jgi:hypothetical protein
MRKFWIFLVILCLVTGSITVHAENFHVKDTIAFGEIKTVTVPQPEGEIDSGWVYFTQEFTFTPEKDGTYHFLVRYEEDESKPYEIFMDVVCPGGYQVLLNGCAFDAVAGESYELCFQYPIHDGRYPEFTFYVGSEEAVVVPETEPAEQITVTEAPEQIPETDDTGASLSVLKIVLCGAAAALLVGGLVILLIAERKKNMNPDPL